MYGISARPSHLPLVSGASCHHGFGVKRRYALRSGQDLQRCQLTVQAIPGLKFILMH